MDSDKSLTTTEEDHEKQLKEEESSKEEIILFQFDKEQCGVVFVFDGETKESVHCPSSFLNRISKEFQKNMVKTDDGSHYEIKAEGFGVDALTKALSFYQPKYFEYLTDSDDFRGILTICDKFGLAELKNTTHCYLMKEHGLNAKQTIMKVDHFPILQTAKDFTLDALYDKMMGLEVGLSFIKDIAKCKDFAGMTDSLKYEILKKCTKKDIGDGSPQNTYNTTAAMEVISIFHFLDSFIYKNKVPDYMVDPRIASSNSPYHPSSFFEKNEINDILVKVEGKELFISSAILADNSPVFKNMLNSPFKEGLENIIVLPGKRAEDIIDLFTSLIHGNKRTEHDAFRLLPLCQEYQIDWLRDSVQEQLMNLKITSDRLPLKYLNLSHNMGFIKGEEKFVNSLCESFIQLQRYKEFNDIKDEAKILVALRRLWYICIKVDGSAFLFDKESGFPSIFKHASNVSFNINETDDKMIASIRNPGK